MASMDAKIRKEIESLGVGKGFFRFDGEKYVSKTYDGEYGKTYLVLYRERIEHGLKRRREVVDQFIAEFGKVFASEDWIAQKSEDWTGVVIRVRIGGKAVVVSMDTDDNEIGISARSLGENGTRLFSSFHSMAESIREGLPRLKEWKSEFDEKNRSYGSEMQWRCDIMIPDDPWGNTCTDKYGLTFTEAFENATSCRAGLGLF